MIFVDLNKRQSFVNYDKIKLLIQRVFLLNDFLILRIIKCEMFVVTNEYFLLKNQNTKLKQSQFLSRFSIHLNRKYDDNKNVFSRQKSFIQRLVDFRDTMRTLNLFAFLREKLKIEIYEKMYLKNTFVVIAQNFVVKSFSMFAFIDEFDFYRNMYRFIMKWYLISTTLNVKNRNRRSNVHVLILESHEFNFDDVVVVVESNLKILNREMYMMINEQKTFVCAFIHDFIENMSQQLNNRKLMKQNAKHDCEYCFIFSINRENLNFDIVKNDRYHQKLKKTRVKLSSMKFIKRIKFMNSINLNKKNTFFVKIVFVLNIIQIKSFDVEHSKYREIDKIFQKLLFTTILILKTQIEYVKKFQTFFFLQNEHTFNRRKNISNFDQCSKLKKSWLSF